VHIPLAAFSSTSAWLCTHRNVDLVRAAEALEWETQKVTAARLARMNALMELLQVGQARTRQRSLGRSGCETRRV
jgi:hypothetical protein